MRILGDRRGTAAIEFGLVALPFFLIILAVFDLGRYALTVNSLETLASAWARTIIISCDTPTNAVQGTVGTCNGSGLPSPTTTQINDIAPFLAVGGYTTTVTPSAGTSTITVTASSNFSMLFSPLLGWSSFNNPSVSVSLRF
jgi:Flp pilus assembly protein TadG